jgi:hypothetical protein
MSSNVVNGGFFGHGVELQANAFFPLCWRALFSASDILYARFIDEYNLDDEASAMEPLWSPTTTWSAPLRVGTARSLETSPHGGRARVKHLFSTYPSCRHTLNLDKSIRHTSNRAWETPLRSKA